MRSKIVLSVLLVLGFMLCASFLFMRVNDAPRKPNVILIMADDMGYECLGAYGSASYHTPNLDNLAANGVRFDHCYSQPLCTPSRVKIMTGKYNFRNYVSFGYLDPAETTFGNLFKDAGYSTCIGGKWQLNGISGENRPGWDDVNRPHHFGFDEYSLWQLHNKAAEGERYADPLIVQNGKAVSRDENKYGPEIISQFILDFIDRKKDRPFFVYYPMTLVHDPFQPTPDSRDWQNTTMRHKKDTAYFKDMVAMADKIVGQLMDKLEQYDLTENTLVIFTGDNGTNRRIDSKMKDGRIISGGKGTMTDAGTRVPLIAYWKGKSLKGAVNSDLVDFTDFFPTLAEAANLAIPKNRIVDGQSFLPQILGKPGKPKEYIYMFYEPRWGKFDKGIFVRNKQYKLYSDGRFYDIVKDVDEAHPIDVTTAGVEASEVRQMLQRRMNRINATIP